MGVDRVGVGVWDGCREMVLELAGARSARAGMYFRSVMG